MLKKETHKYADLLLHIGKLKCVLYATDNISQIETQSWQIYLIY